MLLLISDDLLSSRMVDAQQNTSRHRMKSRNQRDETRFSFASLLLSRFSFDGKRRGFLSPFLVDKVFHRCSTEACCCSRLLTSAEFLFVISRVVCLLDDDLDSFISRVVLLPLMSKFLFSRSSFLFCRSARIVSIEYKCSQFSLSIKNSSIVVLILCCCLFDVDRGEERSPTSTSSSLITLMKKFYRPVSASRLFVVIVFLCRSSFDAEREKGKSEEQTRREKILKDGNIEEACGTTEKDSSSAAVARPTTSVNYYLFYRRTRGKEEEKKLGDKRKRTGEQHQFRSKRCLLAGVREEERIFRKKERVCRDQEKVFPPFSIYSSLSLSGCSVK